MAHEPMHYGLGLMLAFSAKQDVPSRRALVVNDLRFVQFLQYDVQPIRPFRRFNRKPFRPL